jgi:hypothetical protein
MKRAVPVLFGTLTAVSCLVPDFETVDSFGNSDQAGGEGGTSTAGTSSSNGGGSGKAGASGANSGGTSSPTAGTSPTAGMSPTGADCSAGLTDCDGDCVNVDADGSHCGDCDTQCSGGLVCLNGNCDNDCGELTQCGTSCVDLDTDETHCGDCNVPCLGECIGGECDLSCPNARLRCGAACCPSPAANASAMCKEDTCGAECNTNYHDCGTAPLACYADDDALHCGPTCLDCTQPNATATCSDTNSDGVNDGCVNTCVGFTLPCSGGAGKPACGSWDFESATTEGWTIWNQGQADLTKAPSAYAGNFMTRTSRRTSGMRALSVDVDGDGFDKIGIQFKIPLCSGGQAIDLRQRKLHLDVYAQTLSNTLAFAYNDGVNYFLTFNGSESTPSAPGADFNMASDEWVSATLDYGNTDPMVATDIVFWFRVFTPWRGTVFIDNVRFE